MRDWQAFFPSVSFFSGMRNKQLGQSVTPSLGSGWTPVPRQSPPHTSISSVKAAPVFVELRCHRLMGSVCLPPGNPCAPLFISRPVPTWRMPVGGTQKSHSGAVPHTRAA